MKRALASLLVTGAIASLLLAGCASVEDKWREAEQKNSPYSYSAFARKYPDSKYAQTANERSDALFWERAKRGPDKYIRLYIRSYPNGKFIKEAKTELAWLEAKQADSLVQYEKFLADYPESPHASEAKGKIPALEAQARKEAEESAFVRLDDSTTYCPLVAFLASYPDSSRGNAVRARQKDFIKETFARDTLIRWDDPRRHVSEKLYNWEIPSASQSQRGISREMADELGRMRELQKQEANHESFLTRPLTGQQITHRTFLRFIVSWGNGVRNMNISGLFTTSGPIMATANDLLLVEAGAYLPLQQKVVDPDARTTIATNANGRQVWVEAHQPLVRGTVTQPKVINLDGRGCEAMELTTPGSEVSFAMPYTLIPVGSTLKLSGNLPIHLFGIEVLGGPITVKPEGLLLSKGTTLYYKSSKTKAN